MTTRETSLGCTVTTTFGKTVNPLGKFPVGTEIENVTLECEHKPGFKLVKQDTVLNWDWNR